jgi:hypothetical protein
MDECMRKNHCGLKNQIYLLGNRLIGHIKEIALRILFFLVDSRRQDILSKIILVMVISMAFAAAKGCRSWI